MQPRKILEPLLLFVVLTAGTWVKAQDRRDFQLVNYTGNRIASVYVSAHESTDWGGDVLGLDTLSNGYQTRIYFNSRIRTSCFFDFKLVFDDGSTQTYMQGWNLCKFSQIYFYDGYLRAY